MTANPKSIIERKAELIEDEIINYQISLEEMCKKNNYCYTIDANFDIITVLQSVKSTIVKNINK